MQGNTSPTIYQKRAWILVILLSLIGLSCALWIILQGAPFLTGSQSKEGTASSTLLYADIYQDGELLQSIPLSTVTDSFSFTLSDDQGDFNTICVEAGRIGILSASCPDKLCVRQGFINSSLLPITCLPNHLVIQIHQETDRKEATDNTTPDIITY